MCVCEQYETWSAGRPGGHEKRRGGKVAEAGQVEGKEAEIKINTHSLVLALESSHEGTTHYPFCGE